MNPDIERNIRITEEYLEGDITYQELALKEGLSRQRIHQIVKEIEPEAADIVKCLRSLRRELSKVNDTTPNKQCVICEEPFYDRGSRRTCSTGHSELLRRINYHLDPKYRTRQLIATAKYNLKHSKDFAFSRRIVNGEKTAFHGRWVIAGSKVDESIKEVNAIRASKGIKPITLGARNEPH